MAETKFVPIFGSKPPCAYESRHIEHTANVQIERLNWSKAPANQEVVYYEPSDEEDNMESKNSVINTSYNFVDFVRSREYGMKQKRSVKEYFGTRHMLSNELFKEHSLSLNKMNKVLCSQWLNSKAIVFGTKCHKLMIYNVNSHTSEQIQLIKGRIDEEVDQKSGIYSLKMNPSKTLLATTAYNSHEIAVYQLPTFDPVALAESALTQGRIFDVEWLDDEIFVSGSKDSKFALWCVPNDYKEEDNSDGDFKQLGKTFISPKAIRSCEMDHEIRAIKFNSRLTELISLSSNGYINVWDNTLLKQKFSRKVTNLGSSVCMAMESDLGVFVVGCSRYPILVDTRTFSTMKCIPMKHDNCEIRSLSFQENIVTIGTGIGAIMYYDIRAHKFLDTKASGRKKLIVMKTSEGYVEENEHYDMRFPNRNYTPAIYTHCYDYSRMKLFTAGGPLSDNIYGHYASIWQ